MCAGVVATWEVAEFGAALRVTTVAPMIEFRQAGRQEVTHSLWHESEK